MQVATGMRMAFVRAAVRAASTPVNKTQRSVILRVATNADVGVGIRQVKDWNAHLSLRTYESLKSCGIMS